jgi:hypothetical protein
MDLLTPSGVVQGDELDYTKGAVVVSSVVVP